MQRKNLLKKSLAVLMAVAMTAGLAGCGGGSGDSSSSSSSDTSSSSSTESTGSNEAADSGETAAAEDLFGEETSIRVMVWDRGDAAPGTTTEDNNLIVSRDREVHRRVSPCL